MHIDRSAFFCNPLLNIHVGLNINLCVITCTLNLCFDKFALLNLHSLMRYRGDEDASSIHRGSTSSFPSASWHLSFLSLFFLFLRPCLIHAWIPDWGRAFVHGHTFLHSWSGLMTLAFGLKWPYQCLPPSVTGEVYCFPHRQLICNFGRRVMYHSKGL